MSKFNFLKILCVVASIVAGISSQALAVTIDFTALPPSTAVTDQFSGVTFSLWGGNNPNGAPTTSAYYQGTSYGGLTNTVSGGNYPTAEFLVATFSTPVTGVSFSFFDAGFNGGNSYVLYNALNSILVQGLMPAAGNESFYYDLSSIKGVSSIMWGNGLSTGGYTNGGDWWQDLQTLSYTPEAVPEPGTIALLGVGFLGLALYRRKRA